MKILETKSLVIPEIKIIKFSRFPDNRGYFTEHFRKSDFNQNPDLDFIKNVEFLQCNESFSRSNTIRGLHFQWNPYMGKLVRCLSGRLIDLALDIRKDSPTFGKIIACDLPGNTENDHSQWIWIPPGFAHGTLFPEDSLIEYFCSGEYSQNCEAGISPLAKDIDWSLCEPELKKIFDTISKTTKLISEKDRTAFTIRDWANDERSQNFTMEKLSVEVGKKKNSNPSLAKAGDHIQQDVFQGIGEHRILVTGGSGLLGSEIKKILPNADYPTSEQFNLANYQQMDDYLSNCPCDIMLHAAAFTSPPKIDQDPVKGIESNIIGTAYLTTLCMKYGIKLVYISTDYVFRGDQGDYSEQDPVYPVNKYAWSKLGGECAVQLYDNSLIIRTSFGPKEFPYEKAFTDQWTSRESVDQIAAKIVGLLNQDIKGIIHIGGQKQTVFQYAQGLSKERKIGKLQRTDVPFSTPRDTTLNCEKYKGFHPAQ